MSCNTLPGIARIEFIAERGLEIIPRMYLIPGSEVYAFGDFQEIDLVSLASCRTVPRRTDNGLTYTTTIEAETTSDEFSELHNRLQNNYHAYRITDIYRNQYLVGTNKKPFPEITFEPAIDKTPSGQRVTPFVITLTSTLPPLKIKV